MIKKLFIVFLHFIIFYKIVQSRLNLKADYTQKHIIGYSKSDDLNFYNSQDIIWESIDTLVLPPNLKNLQKIIKISQSNNVNAVLNIEGNSLDEDSLKQVINQVKKLDADGVSLIFYKNPSSDKKYLKKVEKMGALLKEISKEIHFSVSISIKNIPYSYNNLIKLSNVDYVIANAYDLGIFDGPVIANSDTNEVRNLIGAWNSTDTNKIILSVPWYGYKYVCDEFLHGIYTSGCINSRKPQKIEFSEIYNYLVGAEIQDNLYITSTEIWNQTSLNPYLNIKEINGNSYDITSDDLLTYYQIQYDNPRSTYLKIKDNVIGGVGVYSLDTLYGLNQNIIKAMYSSINRDFI
ncbi:hypothetical protein DICPUDRAFT_75665 [Dictyostelium purpureum]|uniref:GH18 domain-containing protein n=1 Tax=Dictyostelium purpureum TaxID=5786 RepID=F0ZBB4_DICPU|nr:uncharacterized protein DICPUDRAFT_75665 [Dictyostelium purpureum]EGC38744.1 hypothetical protein DICPUDRAFT_75665 [Dictyostelium purpureum]|eukprot:XP_003284735.1 hypothetical protein DICPUDRAFT_75665 [Dictyostelium purpureum]